MLAEELRKKTAEQLNEELLTLQRNHFNYRMHKATNELSQSHLFKQVRRDIARIKTVLNDKAGNNKDG